MGHFTGLIDELQRGLSHTHFHYVVPGGRLQQDHIVGELNIVPDLGHITLLLLIGRIPLLPTLRLLPLLVLLLVYLQLLRSTPVIDLVS